MSGGANGARDEAAQIDSRRVGREFSAAVVAAVAECKKLGYTPSYFLQMVGEFGAVETARRLISAASVSDGFTRLWELGRLDLTVEALALRDEFQPLFSEPECRQARARLAAYGFEW